MFKVFDLIYRLRIFILFIILEIISISIRNSKNKDSFISSTQNSISSVVLNTSSNFSGYFNLEIENKQLSKENLNLRNKLQEFSEIEEILSSNESSKDIQYSYLLAKVINNSVLKEHNYITINRGSDEGIQPGMALINDDGIVGIIKNTSPNFSTIISLLNTNIRISAKLKNKLEFGTISWNGRNAQYIQLDEIPTHINVREGDTVVTNGYSSIFPEGLMIGIVKNVTKIKGNNFLKIQVSSQTDFRKLNYVYAVKNKLYKEQHSLENYDSSKNK